MPRCTEEEIPLYDLEGGVKVRCVLYDLAAAVVADHQTASADYADFDKTFQIENDPRNHTN
jgi:hypothetical protein